MIRYCIATWFVLAGGLILASGDEVVISNHWSIEELESEEEIYLGKFDLNRLESDVTDLVVSVDYQSAAREEVTNPASIDFDFQYWIQSEFILIGRKDGEEVFEISSGLYEVVNVFANVPAGESALRQFPDVKVFEQLVNEVGQCAGQEIELFCRVHQSLGGGTLELSTLEGYRDIEVDISMSFTTELSPSPSSSIVVEPVIRGGGDGTLKFLSRQGFDYRLIRSEDLEESTVVSIVSGTSAELVFTLAELGIGSPKGFFWVEEIAVDEPED